MKRTISLFFVFCFSIVFVVTGFSNNPKIRGACDCTSGDLVPVRNGSFDSNKFLEMLNGLTHNAWYAFSSGDPDTGHPSVGYQCCPALIDPSCDGGHFSGLTAGPSSGESIGQMIECLVPGNEYMVRFSQSLAVVWGGSSGSLDVSFCGTTIQSPVINAIGLTVPGFSGWQEIELGPFVATANSHILTFTARSERDGVCLDGSMNPTCHYSVGGINSIAPPRCLASSAWACFFERESTNILIDGVSICGTNGNSSNCINEICDDGDPCTVNDFEKVNMCDGSVCEPCTGTPLQFCSDTYYVPCDDGDPCTGNDREEYNSCDNQLCTPCEGNPDLSCLNRFVRSCDDGDPCTLNDVEEIQECDGSVCIPCMGTLIPLCSETFIRSCDDGDPCTFNDEEEIQECDGSICVPCGGILIPFCSTTIARSCDDGDPCTENDFEEINECDGAVCIPCSGVPINFCKFTIVRPCDDGDPCTINDIEELNECDREICSPCQGVLVPSCDSALVIVLPCDDGNPCTENDIEEYDECNDEICSPCQGVPIDCSNGLTQVVSCDDGDSTTINDVQTILLCDGSICIPCSGDPVDCFTGNTSVISCDDGDPCTENDVETVVDSTGQICIPCAGIPIDCGGLGLCELIRSCDDGDSCTINDMETILLRDSSICIPCSGMEITPDIGIDSIVCNENFSRYSIYLQSNFEEIINDQGAPVVELGNGGFLISNIDSSSTIMIRLSYSGTLCSTEITIDPPNCNCRAIADAGPNQVLDCYNNGEVILGGATTSSGANFSYSWTDQNGNEIGIQDSISVVEAGNYTLLVTDLRGNCVDRAMVSVTDIRNEPNATITVFPDTIINCSVESIELFVDPQQDAIYEWNTPSSSLLGRIVEVMESGTITLVVTDTVTGCISQSSIEIISVESYPLVSLNDPGVLNCRDSLVEISLSSFSSTGDFFIHQWYESGGQTIMDEQGTTIEVDEVGMYILETIDTVNHCINRDTVVVGSDFEYPIINAGDTTRTPCDGRSVYLEADAQDILQYELIWSSVDGNIISGDQSLTPEVSGIAWYYLLATHQESGCITLDSVYVDHSVNEIIAKVQSSPPSCPGEPDAWISMELTGAADPIQYSINGVLDPEAGYFQNLEADQYFIEVVDASGCTFDTTILISDPDPLVLELSEDYFEVEQSSFIDLNLLTNADRIDSIIWPDDIKVYCDLCLNPRFQAEISGDYEIGVVNEYGCIARDQFRILIKEEFNIFVPSAFSPNADALNDRLFIHTSNNIEEVTVFEIYARWGEQVFTVSNIPPNDPQYGWDGRFLGKEMNPAVFVYYAILKDRNGKEHVISGDITLIR